MKAIESAFSVGIARALGAAATVLFLAASAGSALAEGWPFAHANSANTGYVPVATRPAGAGSVTVPNIGTFAPGAGPVVAPDGHVYIGNEQGWLTKFAENGNPSWSVPLGGGESVVASPMIWNGYIYVVGVTEKTAALYKYDTNGNRQFRAPFPQHRTGGITTSAPNIVLFSGSNGEPFVVVPAAYKQSGAAIYETHVLLFAESGELTFDHEIDGLSPTTTGSFGGAWIAPGPQQQKPPYPMAATYSDYTTGPLILVADGFQSLVGLTYKNGRLFEQFRYRDTSEMRSFISTPRLTPGPKPHLLANKRAGMLGAQPLTPGAEYTDQGYHSASAPALTIWGSLYVWGSELIIRNANGPQRIPIPGESIAAVAAGKDYFYVSSRDAFTTYRNATYEQVSRVDWVGGGLNPPAIGPKGHVYAIASNILFVFPPPKAIAIQPQQMVTILQPGSGIGLPQPAGVATMPDPDPAAAMPSSQLYHPPLTADGNRLFACEELDQDGCGKGDYGDISRAWCQKQGYPKVKGYDVDGRKVKAETLDGRFCSKNKCKVFDSIACEM